MTEVGDPKTADLLYRGFPDFTEWQGLTSEDLALWDRFAARLEERRQAATPETLQSALDVVIRAAALDTGAIEGLYTVDRGFTMTVAVQGLAWEHAIEERGADVRAFFEAQLEAYELVLDAVTRRLPVTEAWIRALHEKLCAPQTTYRVLTEVGWQEQELPKGRYKDRPNHVRLTDGSFHAYAPVDLVAVEMHRLMEQLRTPAFEAAHPVLQASYAHYALVVIHPFADGNGRVARALASIFFYRAQSIPLLIFADRRPAYLDTLQAADRGDTRPLIHFFRDRGIEAMQLVSESLMESEAPEPGSVVARLHRLLSRRQELSRDDKIILVQSLLGEVEQEIRNQFQDLSGHGVKLSLTLTQGPLVRHALLSVEGLARGVTFEVWGQASEDDSSPFSFRIGSQNAGDALDVRLEEVFPELSQSFRLRLAGWVRRLLGRALADLELQVR